MKTAIEWLFDQIENEGKCIYEVIQQAKEMEEKQIIEAWVDGVINWDSEKEAQQYYNETFKSE